LRTMIEAGAREAWRVASVGILVKVADHSHAGELLLLSDWVKAVVPVQPYTVLHTYRPAYLHDGKRRAERVPRTNGATYLAFRKDGHQHRDFDHLFRRQTTSRLAGLAERRRCAMCDTPIGDRRADAATCSDRCRQRARRQR